MNSSSEALEAACQALEGVYDDVDGAVAGLEDRRPVDGRTETQVTVFGALANDHRVRILEALRDGELCACELQVVLEAPQSTVATHLRTLRDAGLIAGRKKGKWTYYRITDTAVFELLDLGAAVDVPADD
ncbi:ArsR/SmtB family transcription factor [Natronorubrum texcoconense]|uniref:Transcriptional regulator, ArsR family n=1 Tax=Natronorubrum texcoconense TaxID=1095776 RepID=A0A1G8THP2_9EURY|nr:metalloregulator ArsR/SmtB family transcription factor [Natronorubrum texcoconense]SDJ41096.1 transcriptional regulator, ArsR family [Natronorubrum texcoconense]